MLKAPITTHVLDTESGKPAQGIQIELSRAGQQTPLAFSSTDDDGRIMNWPHSFELEPGVYELTFYLEEWFSAQQRESFYPKVCIKFHIKDTGQHYHVPLLLSAHGYSTYRGS